MFEGITKKHRVSVLALLPLFLFALPHSAAAQSDGQKLFDTNCAKCHGKTVEGRFMAGPSLVSGKATAMSADDLRNIITNGKHHMPKFGEKLSTADIDALVDQIQAMNKKK